LLNLINHLKTKSVAHMIYSRVAMTGE
jgi:hypothetical protein